MRIVILSAGTRGDVQPCVALGVGLRQAGYQVRIATHAEFETFVHEHELDFSPLAGNVRGLLHGETGRAWVASARNPIAYVRYGRRLVAGMLDDLLDDCWKACQGADAVLYTLLTFGGWQIAERLRVPCASLRFAPFDGAQVLQRVFPPGPLGLGSRLNRLNNRLGEQLAWYGLTRPAVNRWRRTSLGLPALPFAGRSAATGNQQIPFLFAYSPAVMPKLAHWPPWYHVTGYWFLEAARTWQPPAGLTEFLASGPPPVCIGWGSAPFGDPEQQTRIALEALKRVGCRGILVSGWAGLGRVELPPDVYVIADVPHDWLFPQVLAVVHHGGAGTCAAGFRAGIPAVTTPLWYEQPFWGERVRALGVGPAPIMPGRLTAQSLAEAIRSATTDERMRARAAALGRQIRSEDGVRRAIEILDGLVRAGAGSDSATPARRA